MHTLWTLTKSFHEMGAPSITHPVSAQHGRSRSHNNIHTRDTTPGGIFGPASWGTTRFPYLIRTGPGIVQDIQRGNIDMPKHILRCIRYILPLVVMLLVVAYLIISPAVFTHAAAAIHHVIHHGILPNGYWRID